MKTSPMPIRFNAADLAVLAHLGRVTGLTTPNVVRLAIRALASLKPIDLAALFLEGRPGAGLL